MFALVSADYGTSWGPPRPIPAPGSWYLVAAASPERLVVATGPVGGGGPFRYRLLVSADGGRHWATAVTGTTRLNPQAPGVAALGFESPSSGWWVSDPRSIWITRDGGRSWHRHAVG